MEELKKKQRQMLDGEEKPRPVSPTVAKSPEVRFFGSTTAQPSNISSISTKPMNTASSLSHSSAKPMLNTTSSAVKSVEISHFPVSKPAPAATKVTKPAESVDTLSSDFSSKIVTRSMSTMSTAAQKQKRMSAPVSISPRVKEEESEEDENSVRSFWKKREEAVKGPTKPKVKSVVQATMSFSGSRLPSEKPSVKTAAAPQPPKSAVLLPPSIQEEEAEAPSALDIIKAFNSKASSAPKTSAPMPKPITKSTTKIAPLPPVQTSPVSSTKTEVVKPTPVEMVSGPPVDRRSHLVSTQVPTNLTIIPPPPLDFHTESPTPSPRPPVSHKSSSQTSKIYVNGDSYKTSNFTETRLSSDYDQCSTDFSSSSPLTIPSCTNLNVSMRSVSPTELIIPAPPSSTSVVNVADIPRGVPPPPPSGDVSRSTVMCA